MDYIYKVMFEVRQFVSKTEGSVCANCYSIIYSRFSSHNSTAKSCSSNMMRSVDYSITVVNQGQQHLSAIKQVPFHSQLTLTLSFCASLSLRPEPQIVHNALHRDVRFANLHPDGGDLRELEQRGLCNRLSHRLQEVVRRAFDDILSNPAEEEQSRNSASGNL